jgi:hypothetical protein
MTARKISVAISSIDFLSDDSRATSCCLANYKNNRLVCQWDNGIHVVSPLPSG